MASPRPKASQASLLCLRTSTETEACIPLLQTVMQCTATWTMTVLRPPQSLQLLETLSHTAKVKHSHTPLSKMFLLSIQGTSHSLNPEFH